MNWFYYTFVNIKPFCKWNEKQDGKVIGEQEERGWWKRGSESNGKMEMYIMFHGGRVGQNCLMTNERHKGKNMGNYFK